MSRSIAHMNPIIEISLNVLKPLLMPVVAGLVCGVFVSWQAKRSLSRREFLDRVNFSLNILHNGQLKIRTLIEKPASEVFLNPEITKIVHRAAADTTKEDCLLPIADPADYWLCLNALLNEVSEKFALGFLKEDIDSSAQSEVYVMCLTCEIDPNIKTKKIRAMLIKKTSLINFPIEDPEVAFPSHAVRIETMRQISKQFQSGEKDYRFVEVVLCV